MKSSWQVCGLFLLLLCMARPAFAEVGGLSMVLLPGVGESDDLQLAVRWNGGQAGLLSVSAVDAQLRLRPLLERRMAPGMHVEPVTLAPDDLRLLAVLRDSSGRELARTDQAARIDALLAADSASTGDSADSPGLPKGSEYGWQARFVGNHGPERIVRAMTIHDDGSGPALVIGGDFVTAGGLTVNRVARWNGQSWAALGTGVNSRVQSLTSFRGDLIAVGRFTAAGGQPANGIARWNGTNWAPLGTGTGINGVPLKLLVHDDSLYVGGEFASVDGVAARNLARWDGQQWSTVGGGLPPGFFNAWVVTMVEFEGHLIVGGSFFSANGVPANNIARWDGQAWSALGSGLNGRVNALAVYNGDLYAGGEFTSSGQTIVNRVARWRAGAWSALSTGVDGVVHALDAQADRLVVGGLFNAAGGLSSRAVAAWNGSEWIPMNPETAPCCGGVYSITSHEGRTVIGGTFLDDGAALSNVASWNGSAWVGLGSVTPTDIRATALFRGELIIAGYFPGVPGTRTPGVAKWDGVRWSAMDAGIGGGVLTLAVHDDRLYAGGHFSVADGSPANFVAQWDGVAWTGLGDGPNSSVESLTVHQGSLVAGGFFQSAGGVPARNIARWNGSAWSPIGQGLGGPVRALTVHNGELVAGGDSLVDSSAVARWNGITWLPVGAGLERHVNVLLSHDGALFAAGSFTSIGGTPVNRIARWNGGDWQSLSSGIQGDSLTSVRALRIHRGDLIVGGLFETAGGVPSRDLARWNGSEWAPMGVVRPISFGVQSLNHLGDDLLAAGSFYSIDGIPSPSIATYGLLQPTSVQILDSEPNPSRVGDQVRIRVRVTGESAPAAGHVTVTGSPGGSCSDLSLSPTDSVSVEAECHIRWDRVGTASLMARYVGGTIAGTLWQPSSSAVFIHTVAPDDRLFGSGFEAILTHPQY